MEPTIRAVIAGYVDTYGYVMIWQGLWIRIQDTQPAVSVSVSLTLKSPYPPVSAHHCIRGGTKENTWQDYSKLLGASIK